MLTSRTLCFVLAAVTSSLAFAAPPAQIPFVPSMAQRPNSHAGRFGLITMVTYGAYGQKSTITQVIDLDAFISSGGKNLAVGENSTRFATQSTPVCIEPGLDGTCEDGSGSGDDGLGGTGSGGTGGGGNINPNGSGPDSDAPPPPPPNLPFSDNDVGTVTYTQYYDGGRMQETTTYNRTVTPNPNGGFTDGSWGSPVSADSPTKGH